MNYYMRRDDSASKSITSLDAPTDTCTKIPEGKQYTIDELLDFPEQKKIYEDASDRDRVIEQLKAIKISIDSDLGYKPRPDPYGKSPRHYIDLFLRKYKAHIIYMPEGSGKSHLVVNLAADGQKIIFACKSWEQVEKKYDEYKRMGIHYGFNVRIVRSKEAKARRRFKTKAVRAEKTSPFDTPPILDEETINLFIKNNPDLSSKFVRLAWQFFSSDRISFDYIPQSDIQESEDGYKDCFTPSLEDNNTRIICTTFDQLRIHKLKNVKITKDWIIWFDDPDMTDLIDISPYEKNEDHNQELDEAEKNITVINNTKYLKRDKQQSLGYSVMEHKCIYTTTELITLKLLEKLIKSRKEEYVIHDKMENILSGKITILGTQMVRKRYDGVIPLLARQLTKKYPMILIADGLSSKFNHSNNKGRNDLSEVNVLVELSYPHPSEIKTIADSLGVDFIEYRNELTQNVMLDRLHQAIGRNSGYRWKGSECVALVEKNVHKKITDGARYKIDTKNSVVIDRTQSMSRKDTRLTESASELVQEVEAFINNITQYLCDHRKVKPDIEHVLSSIEEQDKRVAYTIRLLFALCELSGITISKTFFDSKPVTNTQKKYWSLINWILEAHTPHHVKELVVTKLLKAINENQGP